MGDIEEKGMGLPVQKNASWIAQKEDFNYFGDRMKEIGLSRNLKTAGFVLRFL